MGASRLSKQNKYSIAVVHRNATLIFSLCVACILLKIMYNYKFFVTMGVSTNRRGDINAKQTSTNFSAIKTYFI